ncbi:AAA family ATPase [Pseudochrobactrum sp. Wa41.01b-1]|uniref:UvrD-helicase domain-containing protein n=1 Tax=Pseudochrobactrum sp. Wa41.01b-1 TaxID=2864102 RepID=UPI001C68F872|nr:UvrD-helicase domain-containing protein [Pseudochrobactrum sp. Wa41.01b-1]QYM72024.1 AAA family ATPase [Pseudochrobactrum sp. Wa41.01b-1]
MPELQLTETDIKIAQCIDESKSFTVVAGAGSGKTTSLIEALKKIRETHGRRLRKRAQRIVCITYTNRAVDVIFSRLGYDELYVVTTLHGFLWGEVSRFQAPLRRALIKHVIPARIEKAQQHDNGGNSKTAVTARKKVERLQIELAELIKNSPPVRYEETTVSDYSKCILNHDDIIDVASYLIMTTALLRKGIGFKYPYIFIDEAQDTFPQVMSALNSICASEGLPIIGYFGDPMQQIYDKRAGDFTGPDGTVIIAKNENFRSSGSVINLLNRFRDDIKQFPAGKNAGIEGSVEILIARAPSPQGPRKTYTPEQLDQVSSIFNDALLKWEWQDSPSVKKLFLARQMIARRLNFSKIHRLFTGVYSSLRSQSAYEDGTHYLLKPFIESIYPLILATKKENPKLVIDVLRKISPAFSLEGVNKGKSLKQMLNHANELTKYLADLWNSKTIHEIFKFCEENALLSLSERLSTQLNRNVREVFDSENDDHERDKGDWLADEFFKMDCSEISAYVEFLDKNSPFSTQHGSKGEEYPNVMVMIDDIEASWNNYSFGKTLTPDTAGDPTHRQAELTKKLAYVCFSRAELNLRVLFFSLAPEHARRELIDKGLFEEKQVSFI